MLSRKLAAVAAISLVTASSAAVAQSAPLSVAGSAVAPVSASAEGSNELVGTTAWIIAAIALGLVIWGIIELTDDDSKSP